jgi:hypothetical protein
MSGYIEKDILGIDDVSGLQFIQKPFTSTKLLESVRRLLDGN